MSKKLVYVSSLVVGLLVIVVALLVQVTNQVNEVPISNQTVFSFFPKGKQQYDIVLFQPNTGQKTSFDGVTFLYKGNSTVVDECKHQPYVNQTELKDFQVTLRTGGILNTKLCWPPPHWFVPSKYLISSLSTAPPLRYDINWFDENYTEAVAFCNSSICPYGSMIYMVQKQS